MRIEHSYHNDYKVYDDNKVYGEYISRVSALKKGFYRDAAGGLVSLALGKVIWRVI